MRFRKMVCILMALMMLFTAGCGLKNKDRTIILTTGFGKDVLFRIENMECTRAEMMVYLTNIHNQYQKVYGKGIWKTSVDGVSLGENVREMALAQISQVKTICLLAEQRGVVLEDSDIQMAESAANQYYESLNQTEIEMMGVDVELLTSMYKERLLADKLYQYIIRDINPEISDDEARTITIDKIFFKTYEEGEDGNRREYSQEERELVRMKAQDVLDEIREGADFDKEFSEYSDSEEKTVSFGKGEAGYGFETAAFDLGNDQVSNLIQTKDGYYILKCISTFNREVTDENKIKIVELRKQEAFDDEYQSFAASLVKSFNDSMWEDIKFIENDNVTTDTFFIVLEEYNG